MGERLWTLEMSFSENEVHTRADAWLRIGDREMHVVGHAKRNLADPQMPSIGEELAAARALGELSHDLLHQAVEAIELHEGRRVELHA